jgi:AcrR family transcriptional regulator
VPTAAPLGLRERKKLRTRREIAEAANHLITEHGIEHVTIEQIAAAADVAPRTFFRYFDSKEDAFLSDHRDKLATFRAALLERPANEGALTAVRTALLGLADIYEIDRDEVLCKARLVAESPGLHLRSLELHADLQQSIADAIATRMHVDLADDMRPAVIAAAVSGALQAALGHWVANGAREDLPTLVGAALDLLDGGLDEFGRP